jgi:tRNA pseudouridine32 synthase/23S rRNA pseudouridine746 synthase/23S rRNA pseudouridine1911/1915/1917 synthase
MPKTKKPNTKHLPRGLEILYMDDDILVISKPAGLLTVGTDTNRSKTVYYCLTDFVRKGNPKSRNRIFIVHRLDRETSGVIVFAKNEDAKFALQSDWENTQKKYLAVVYGQLAKKQGTIKSYLAENKMFKVYSTDDPTKGKLAHTAYKVLKETPHVSLLEIALLTGRKNQIRVHLADIGHPIIGDRKYGKPKDPYKRMALHADSITFKHPVTGKMMTFEAQMPSEFKRFLKTPEPTTAETDADAD